MSNIMRRGIPSIFNLRRDIEDVLEQFSTPRALRREIERVFGDEGSLIGGRGQQGMFIPQLELMERDNDYALRVDLPGVRQEDVQVSVDDDNILTIRGHRQDESTRQARGGYEYTERSYGTFVRSVELPRGVDPGKIDAEYRDGVLELHIPKGMLAAGRQIPVRMREGGRMQGREQQQLGQHPTQQQGQQQMQGQQQGQQMQGQQMQGGQQQGREQPRVMSPGDAGDRRNGRAQTS